MNKVIVNGVELPHWFKHKANGVAIYATTITGNKFLENEKSGFVMHAIDAIPIIVKDLEQKQEKQPEYVAWDKTDVNSLLFFKDKIFREKTDKRIEATVIGLDLKNGCEVILSVGVKCHLSQLFSLFEYSTDGQNWLPCGKVKELPF